MTERVGGLLPTASTTIRGLMPSNYFRQINSSENKYDFDLNNIKREARMIVNATTINNPLATWGCCEVLGFEGVIFQKVYEYFGATSIHIRSYNNGRWSAWVKYMP